MVQERIVEAWTRLAVMEIGKKNGNVIQRQNQQDFLDRLGRAKEGKDSFSFDLSLWVDDRSLTP